MKKLLCTLLCLMLIFTMIPMATGTAFAIGPGPNDWDYTGDGTIGNPYIISTITQLKSLAIAVNTGTETSDYYIELSADIGDSGDPFTTPIGDSSHQFKGNFDGKGHTVYLAINQANSYGAMFGYIGEGGSVSNLITDGTVVNSSDKNYFAGVCGYNEGTIKNCINDATVTATGNNAAYFGGICGWNTGNIINCTNNATITGTASGHQIGGICGYNNINCNLFNCVNNGAVSGAASSYSVGGISGDNSATATNCINTSTVTVPSPGDKVGSLFGYSNISNNCYYDKEVQTSFGAIGQAATNAKGEGLSTAQMKAASGAVLATGVADNKPLVDLLNNYIADNSATTAGWAQWSIDASGYPCLPVFTPAPGPEPAPSYYFAYDVEQYRAVLVEAQKLQAEIDAKLAEKKQTEEEKPVGTPITVEQAKALVTEMIPVVRTENQARGIKVFLQDSPAINKLKASGFKVLYDFYRAEANTVPKAEDYKITTVVNKEEPWYLNTAAKKGKKYYYKAVAKVYDANGELVAESELTQGKYGCRTR